MVGDSAWHIDHAARVTAGPMGALEQRKRGRRNPIWNGALAIRRHVVGGRRRSTGAACSAETAGTSSHLQTLADHRRNDGSRRGTTASKRRCGAAALSFAAWFDPPFAERATVYLSERGFAVSGHLIQIPEPKWRDVAPGELYGRFMHLEQRIDDFAEQIMAGCPAAADAILIAGTGFRCVAILDALERALDRPVISANQASLWNCLRLSGCSFPIAGYGRLLRGEALPQRNRV